MNDQEADAVVAIEEPLTVPCEAVTGALIDRFLDYLRRGYFSDFFEQNEKWLRTIGLMGLYASAVLGLLASFVLPLRYDFPLGTSVGIGFIWFFACIVVHYTAWKFLPVLSHIIETTPTKMSSRAFLDSLALVAGIAGVISLIGGLYLWAKTASFDAFCAGIFAFILCEYVLSLCLNPRLLNIEIGEKTSVGEEFLCLVSFFMKGLLKLVPIAFGSGILFGVIDLIDLVFSKFEHFSQISDKASGIAEVAVFAVLPVLAYLLFLAYYFVIDLAMAVLSIPTRIGALRDAR